MTTATATATEITTAKKPASTKPRTSKPKATAEPGTKPRFLVVEKAFFAQTSNGELRLSLGMKFGSLMGLMDMNTDGKNQFAEFDFLLNNIFSEAELVALRDLDWEETIEILMEYMTVFQKLIGVSMGKFGGSSAS